MVFRDGDEVVMQSRNGKELGRYFPELITALRDELAPRCVLDGEVVVPREIDGRVRLDWDSLSGRIHPAESRVRMLAEQTPAHFIGFDALAVGDRSLMAEPFRVRRSALTESVGEGDWCHVTRTTEDRGWRPVGSRPSRVRASTAWLPSGSRVSTCRANGRW